MSKYNWKKISTRKTYIHSRFNIIEDRVIRPDGAKGIYNFVSVMPAVIVLPVTDKKEIMLIRQYRYPVRKYSWELPGGSSDGKALLPAAKRELWEETGYEAAQWNKLGSFQMLGGISNGVEHVYIARKLKKVKQAGLPDEAIVAVRAFNLKTIAQMIRDKKIRDAQTISALMLGFMHLGLRL
ncbi:MAG: hypothetical protein A3A97_01505 [Candidatus Terrybacteria bacterium RIFCSPLOWO2_01_FULL_40_23]|uniref:Nudix hydrolase domain-containing protein n=1 Tax=Candidatus Terrybacteria bacterium RIFCSPLOWO2_01_FULL_40_23 TaxID=1802366 RepID=A0A1G2PSM0_9BACT|nr:MAG: NUDIX hydrolase [Parcubacteria group bacterium GW2011_GWB1_40_14]OHA50749.1 MAG: hypothetical protein A3A97_01505 [Candidatus Terrybacteria bacterium RIFCSPLOWO2_01_FULL_40_23]